MNKHFNKDYLLNLLKSKFSKSNILHILENVSYDGTLFNPIIFLNIQNVLQRKTLLRLLVSFLIIFHILKGELNQIIYI